MEREEPVCKFDGQAELAVELKLETRVGEGPGFTAISTKIVKSIGGSCPGMARDVKPRLEGLLSALFVLLNPAEVVKLSLVAEVEIKLQLRGSKFHCKIPEHFHEHRWEV